MSTTAAVLDSPQPAHDTVATPHSTTTKPTGITDKTWHSLSRKGKIFVSVCVNGESALTAYEAAGYDPGGTDIEHRKRNAYNVKRGKRVIKALLEHEQDREARESFDRRWDLDEIVKEHERLLEVAETAGNLAVATRNLELIGRTRGVYAEVVIGDVAARREYSEVERIEAMRLGNLLLEDADEDRQENGAGNGVGKDQQQERERDENGKYAGGNPDDPPLSGHPPSPQGDNGQERSQEKPGELPLTPATGVGYCGPDIITKPDEEGRA